MESVLDDAQLIQAARRRLLRMLESGESPASIINNIGSGGPSGSSGGLVEKMSGGGEEDPGLFDYLVDIEKTDIPGGEGEKPIGWRKKVHRYRTKKGESGK
jgi:hypothetical protein